MKPSLADALRDAVSLDRYMDDRHIRYLVLEAADALDAKPALCDRPHYGDVAGSVTAGEIDAALAKGAANLRATQDHHRGISRPTGFAAETNAAYRAPAPEPAAGKACGHGSVHVVAGWALCADCFKPMPDHARPASEWAAPRPETMEGDGALPVFPIPAPLPVSDEAGIEEEALVLCRAYYGDRDDSRRALPSLFREEMFRVARAARAMREKERRRIATLERDNRSLDEDIAEFALRAEEFEIERDNARERQEKQRKAMAVAQEIAQSKRAECDSLRDAIVKLRPLESEVSAIRAKLDAAERERDALLAPTRPGLYRVIGQGDQARVIVPCSEWEASQRDLGIARTELRAHRRALRTAPPASALDVEAAAKEINERVHEDSRDILAPQWKERGFWVGTNVLTAILRKHLRPCAASVVHTVDFEAMAAWLWPIPSNAPERIRFLKEAPALFSRAASVEDVAKAINDEAWKIADEPHVPEENAETEMADHRRFAARALSALGIALGGGPDATDAILAASDEQIREACGDSYGDLARRGKEAAKRALAGTSLVCEACGCRWKQHPPCAVFPKGSLQLYDANQKPCARCDNAPNPPLRHETPEDDAASPEPASELGWTVLPQDVRDSLVWTTNGPWVSRPHPLDGPMALLGIDTESTAKLITKRVNDRAAALTAQGLRVAERAEGV